MRSPTLSPNRHSATASEGSSVNAEASPRLRDTLRVLRYLEKVEIGGVSLNWEATKCYVVLVFVRDTETLKQAYAHGNTSHWPAPFQIERTPAEFKQLLQKMHQSCLTCHTRSDKPCAVCTPIVSNAIVGEALRTAAEQADDDDEPITITSYCFGFGFLMRSVEANALRPETGNEWVAWLNATIAHLRVGVSLQADATDVCDGARHVPALLARFLFDEFWGDVIPIGV